MTFVIMAFALYVPALKGKSKADALSGQTVVFAFVFVAVRMSWAFVVKQRQSNPVPLLPASPVPLLPAQQTLFESAAVEVEGFPQAAVVDKDYSQYVHGLYADKLVAHFAEQNPVVHVIFSGRITVSCALPCLSYSPTPKSSLLTPFTRSTWSGRPFLGGCCAEPRWYPTAALPVSANMGP